MVVTVDACLLCRYCSSSVAATRRVSAWQEGLKVCYHLHRATRQAAIGIVGPLSLTLELVVDPRHVAEMQLTPLVSLVACSLCMRAMIRRVGAVDLRMWYINRLRLIYILRILERFCFLVI